jgi:hypothetical protein
VSSIPDISHDAEHDDGVSPRAAKRLRDAMAKNSTHAANSSLCKSTADVRGHDCYTGCFSRTCSARADL